MHAFDGEVRQNLCRASDEMRSSGPIYRND